MSLKYAKGEFIPKNPQKYVGKTPITYRSAWELSFMQLLDKHPNIINWASESVQIPYYNPFTKRNTVYIPDFLIVYLDKNSKMHSEIVEIKPLKETLSEMAKSKRDKFAVALNTIKWSAAQAYCKKAGITFRVMTEEQLFRTKGR